MTSGTGSPAQKRINQRGREEPAACCDLFGKHSAICFHCSAIVGTGPIWFPVFECFWRFEAELSGLCNSLGFLLGNGFLNFSSVMLAWYWESFSDFKHLTHCKNLIVLCSYILYGRRDQGKNSGEKSWKFLHVEKITFYGSSIFAKPENISSIFKLRL